jgi:hypothetical protein
MRSVDDWPLAKDFARFLGVSPGQYPLSRSTDVTGRWYPPLEGCMLQSQGLSLRGPIELCGGPFLGELSGGNWMAFWPAGS